MKKSNNVRAWILGGSVSLVMVACGQSTKNEHDQSTHQQEVSDETVSQNASLSKDEATAILNAYLEVKDALVKTDGEAAKAKATHLVSLLDSKDELAQKVKFDAEHIAQTHDTDHQRDHFNTLSENVYVLVKNTSANENTIYRQYCPMAFDNKGAYWLSAEKEVNNPYFGDIMLHCGVVHEEL